MGLGLSGGKTVRIGLRDHNNRPVTNPDDLKQAVNELYTRINKMGVSERTIHIENNNIILDFPGSQNLSAAELVKASAMYFHIVNEKFSKAVNAPLKESSTNSCKTFGMKLLSPTAKISKASTKSPGSIWWRSV